MDQFLFIPALEPLLSCCYLCVSKSVEWNFVSDVNVEDRPSRGLRQLLAVIGCGLLAVFAIATWLEPDDRGFGTHERLGFPPCVFRNLTGVNCPHCGMTTCFANVVRGNFRTAWHANPAGIPLVIVFALSIPYCFYIAVSGRWLGTQQPFFWFILFTLAYLTLALITWSLRLLI